MERGAEICNRLGLHARAAAKLVTLAATFSADVRIRARGREVSGKSIMGVLMLAAAQGTQVTLIAEGADEAEALDALCKLIENRFEEES